MCGGVISHAVGRLAYNNSDGVWGYAFSYSFFQIDCLWTLTAPWDMIIELNITHFHIIQTEKVQVRKDQEKAQSEKDSHSKNRGGKKPNQQSGTYTMKHIVSRMSSYFPNRWPLSR